MLGEIDSNILSYCWERSREPLDLNVLRLGRSLILKNWNATEGKLLPFIIMTVFD